MSIAQERRLFLLWHHGGVLKYSIVEHTKQRRRLILFFLWGELCVCLFCSSGCSFASTLDTSARYQNSRQRVFWPTMADWSLLGNFLEEVQEHSTSVGKVWIRRTHTMHVCQRGIRLTSSAQAGRRATRNKHQPCTFHIYVYFPNHPVYSILCTPLLPTAEDTTMYLQKASWLLSMWFATENHSLKTMVRIHREWEGQENSF